MRSNELGLLMRGITANVNLYIGSKVEKHGIKQGQYEYFLHICSSPGINQRELAHLKNVGKASVTKALKILEEDGFVRRKIDEKDRRNTKCYVSAKGAKIVEDLMDVKTMTEKKLLKGFKNEDIEILYHYLERLYENSKDINIAVE